MFCLSCFQKYCNFYICCSFYGLNQWMTLNSQIAVTITDTGMISLIHHTENKHIKLYSLEKLHTTDVKSQWVVPDLDIFPSLKNKTWNPIACSCFIFVQKLRVNLNDVCVNVCMCLSTLLISSLIHLSVQMLITHVLDEGFHGSRVHERERVML